MRDQRLDLILDQHVGGEDRGLPTFAPNLLGHRLHLILFADAVCRGDLAFDRAQIVDHDLAAFGGQAPGHRLTETLGPARSGDDGDLAGEIGILRHGQTRLSHNMKVGSSAYVRNSPDTRFIVSLATSSPKAFMSLTMIISTY